MGLLEPTETDKAAKALDLRRWATVWHAGDMKQSERYNHGAHTRYHLQYHLVWVPKYRKRVLRGPVASTLKLLFYQCAEMNDWWIVRLAIQPDHVHMLLELPPTITVAKAVQIMKGGSSRAVRQTNPELEEWLWGDSFWADGYFAESVGKVDETIIKAYIENQAGPSRPKVR